MTNCEEGKNKFSYRVLSGQVEGILGVFLGRHQHGSIEEETSQRGFVSLHEVFPDSCVILTWVEIHSVLEQLPVRLLHNLEVVGRAFKWHSTCKI